MASQRARGGDESLVTTLISADVERRLRVTEADAARAEQKESVSEFQPLRRTSARP